MISFPNPCCRLGNGWWCPHRQ